VTAARRTGDAAPDRGADPSLRKDTATRRQRIFDRVLVANRGEIALRIIRACRELELEAVAVYSDADAGAAHVRAADEAVRLGPAPAAESYLRAEGIIEAARRTGAGAIHPGYGFLAERASFARAVEAAGIVFVGPPSTTIEALGDKLAARRVARDAGVAVVPGTLEPAPVDRADAVDRILAEAEAIGVPLLVKAAAGGGGRGMRRVERLADLPAALAAGSAEAAAAFGDGSVYLEREVRPARHIEVQLMGDGGGRVVALGERDCSLQRRHQKLVEESPAPGLTDDERTRLLADAVRLGEAAGLVNAATAEFLFDAERRFWFLEVNTRLQVEHGVTELVAEVDIVREQLRIAAGEPLSAAILEAGARAARPARHAIEVRISAEDPARDFAPAPGRIGHWQTPAGPGVRIDAAVEAGERIAPDYDPMFAKVLVVDADRGAAIDRLRRALDELEVTGVTTTLPFHRFVARDLTFRAGGISTDWVPQHWQPAMAGDRRRALDAALLAAGLASVARRDGAGGSGEAVPPAMVAPAVVGEVSLRKDSTGPAGEGWPAGGAPWRRSGRARGVDRWPR
jgi:acetyl/propionyl-CoA carboxylase alpha subunit